MVKRIALGNHKGGSGKTSVAIGLAGALAEMGKRVLVVDMDPQANASRRLGAAFDPDDPAPTTAEVVRDGTEGIAAEAIRPCGWREPYSDLIGVIPSRFDLDNRLSESGQIGAVLRLSVAMTGADDEYDITLLDCQPSLAHLTQLALATADGALAVVDPEYDGVDGGMRYRDFVENPHTLRGLGNPALRFLGVVVNDVDRRVGAHTFQLEQIPSIFGENKVWQPVVPARAATKDAADAVCPLRDIGTPPARDQADVMTELATRLLKEVSE